MNRINEIESISLKGGVEFTLGINIVFNSVVLNSNNF